eukprot:scaffold303805_cov24-Attheya_sp.AAC.3
MVTNLDFPRELKREQDMGFWMARQKARCLEFWVVPVYWMGQSWEFEMVGGLEYWMVLCLWTGLLNYLG